MVYWGSAARGGRGRKSDCAKPILQILIPTRSHAGHPTLAFSRAAVVDRECLEHMIAHEIAVISLDA